MEIWTNIGMNRMASQQSSKLFIRIFPGAQIPPRFLRNTSALYIEDPHFLNFSVKTKRFK